MHAESSFRIIYAPQVKEHLKTIDKKHHHFIRYTIETQLQFEPDVETRNRKPLKRPAELGAEWEIRFGPDNRFRVFYAVEREKRQILILAIGSKRHNILIIGGEEVVI